MQVAFTSVLRWKSGPSQYVTPPVRQRGAFLFQMAQLSAHGLPSRSTRGTLICISRMHA